jgi:26S proteasome regulatory complex component
MSREQSISCWVWRSNPDRYDAQCHPHYRSTQTNQYFLFRHPILPLHRDSWLPLSPSARTPATGTFWTTKCCSYLRNMPNSSRPQRRWCRRWWNSWMRHLAWRSRCLLSKLCAQWLRERYAENNLILTGVELIVAKIFVEVERARVTRILSNIKKTQGDLTSAADILCELQVETFGSMTRREKTEFILEQVSLCIERGDWTQAQILSRKINKRYFNRKPKKSAEQIETLKKEVEEREKTRGADEPPMEVDDDVTDLKLRISNSRLSWPTTITNISRFARTTGKSWTRKQSRTTQSTCVLYANLSHLKTADHH